MSNFSVGIVGLPNVGKSTLFNALLKQNLALAANYPFATIEPNTGIAEVPDERLALLAPVVHTQVLKPATVEFIDIAGLVAGAATGEGLGNKFLANIRETALICHVLRAFENTDIVREGSVDPIADLSVVRTELQLADLATLERQKPPKGAGGAEAIRRWTAIEKMKSTLESGQMLNQLDNELIYNIATELNLLTSKKELFVLNVSEEQLRSAEKIKLDFAQSAQLNSQQIVVISAQIESELAVLDEADQKLYLADFGLDQSGLERLAKVAYHTLGLQSFLTAGELEVRAWTIPVGTLAPDAAAVIHTDFRQKFIKAQVINWRDFIDLGGWKKARESGKVRTEGRDYMMQEGDVVEFMIGS